MFALGALAVWFVFAAVGAVASTWLIRRVWRRRSSLPLAARVLLAVVAALLVFSALGTVVGIVKAFGVVGGESVDPSQKARILAEGIAQAMNCTAFGVIIWVPSAVAAFVLGRPRKDGPV